MNGTARLGIYVGIATTYITVLNLPDYIPSGMPQRQPYCYWKAGMRVNLALPHHRHQPSQCSLIWLPTLMSLGDHLEASRPMARSTTESWLHLIEQWSRQFSDMERTIPPTVTDERSFRTEYENTRLLVKLKFANISTFTRIVDATFGYVSPSGLSALVSRVCFVAVQVRTGRLNLPGMSLLGPKRIA